jgi:hypothetical protein
MEIKGDRVIFASGRVWYANGGTIGLSQIENDIEGGLEWSVSEGWDGGLSYEELTPSERDDLADYMIAAWSAFKAQTPAGA